MGLKQNLHSINYVLISNCFSFLVSTIVMFFIPKKLGIESYGYFQLYLLYTSYIGFLHFGWADGIFLRYGGEYYEALDKGKFSGQFLLYSVVEIFIGITVCLIGYNFASSYEKSTIFFLTGLTIIVTLPRTFLEYILQGTNRIKEYATLTIIDRFIYFIGIFVILIMEIDSFVLVIVSDLIGKSVALLYACIKCKSIIFFKPNRFMLSLKEAFLNIKVGIKLMFANIASMLVIGLVRLAIEDQWDIATFSKISLTLSVSNLLMVFIRAVASVMFPILRRTNQEKLSQIYLEIRTCLMTILLGMLVVYYPVKSILSIWLPQYSDSLIYMAILFPICIYESKMSMLIDTYMKTMRKEKWLLLVNIVTVIFSFIMTGVTVYFLHNLNFAIISIVLVLSFRSVFAELLLASSLKISVIKDIFWELCLTVIFIVSSWFVRNYKGMLIYFIFYIVYLFIKRKNIVRVLKIIKNSF